jgi:hypothetical protein
LAFIGTVIHAHNSGAASIGFAAAAAGNVAAAVDTIV